MRRATSTRTWTGEFQAPRLEALFRRCVRRQTRRQLRTALAVMATLILMFGITDYLALGAGPVGVTLIGLRLAIAIGCVAMILALRRRPSLVDRSLPLNLLILLGVGFTILLVPLRPGTIDTQMPTVVVATLAIYLLIPNRLGWAALHGVLLGAGFLTATWHGALMPPGTLLIVALVLVYVNVVSLMIHRRLTRLQRERFASLHEERLLNRRLREEIERRRRLERRLEGLAHEDDLTGLPNRRHFFTLADQALRRARRSGIPLTVIMFDLDHFKRVNDRFGHAVGDRVLAGVASRCRDTLRETDILGRLGGEEFAVLLPDTPASEACRIAERLRAAVNGLGLSERGEPIPLSVTLGIAGVHPTEPDLSASLARADAALYRGKRQGRDRTVLDPPTAMESEA